MASVLATQTSARDSLTFAGLYLHIPFCDKRCGYCDFATSADQAHLKDRYVRALGAEMRTTSPRTLDSIYWGGGTPTTLSAAQIQTLATELKHRYVLAPNLEWTVEANPESAQMDRLEALREAGVNRLSFGFQVWDDAILQRLGRLHSVEGFVASLRRARDLGFSNLSIDLMYGLPGQTLEGWKETVQRTLSLAPEHVSLYGLKVEHGTPFEKEGIRVDDDLQADMYLWASDHLAGQGWDHYEISNFCRPTFESRHNLKYWRREPVLALGVSAAGFTGSRRTRNPGTLARYLEAIEGGADHQSFEAPLSPLEEEGERLMLSLRLREGAIWREVQDRANATASRFLDQGWARREGDRFVLTPQGWLLSNQLFQSFV